MILVVSLVSNQYVQSKLFDVATIELEGLKFMSQPSGVRVPEIYGDFATTCSLTGVFPVSESELVLVFVSPDGVMQFALGAKTECPEAIVLVVSNLVTNEVTFWIYEKYNQPKKVTETEFNTFINQPHPCTVISVPRIEI